jgi:SAM-dependent methyltransferase
MNTLRRLSFNLWYNWKPPWDTGISPPELMDFISHHPPGHALDLGCGTGTNVITLAQHGWQATGVDFARRAIQKARRKAHQANVLADFRVEDVTRLKGLSGPFDLVLDMGCFHSLPPEGRQAYLINLDRLLAPDGTFLLYVFFRNSNASGPGLEESDLLAFHANFSLVDRQEGSERGMRRSAWLTYHRPRSTFNASNPIIDFNPPN